MTAPEAGDRTAEQVDQRERRAAMVGGAVFLVTGASLVVHIVTGAPLWALLAGLVGGSSLVIVRIHGAQPAVRRRWLHAVRTGATVGAIATVCYDASRWLLVEVAGMRSSPFAAWPFFGEALLGGFGGTTVRTVAGATFHAINGVAFGVAYTAWFGRRSPWWGIPFALALEAFMLALYPGWLDVRSLQELTEISLLGHVVYGIVLGWGTWFALQRRRPQGRPGSTPCDRPT